MSAPPKFAEGGKTLDVAWVNGIFPDKEVKDVAAVSVTDAGGFMGDMSRVVVTFEDGEERPFIFKQIVGESKLAVSKLIGCSREAFFYNSDLSKEVNYLLPEMVYAYGDAATGEKYLFMEDLSRGVQSGFLFGPSSPNNWAKQQAGELVKINENFLGGEVTLEAMCEAIVRGTARLHAAYWQKRDLLDLEWLRGTQWWQRDNEVAWAAAMGGATSNWSKAQETVAQHPEVWEADLVALVNASFNKATFPAYLELTKTSAWSLVHGDFHPANVMWMGEKGAKPNLRDVKLVDWEMVGVGNGAQEIGQFMVSHMEPATRRACEESIVKAYYDELTASGVSSESYSWEQCWSDYKCGGIGRWLWFIGWMAASMPVQLNKFFTSQVAAFARDHGFTPDNVPLPRV